MKANLREEKTTLSTFCTLSRLSGYDSIASLLGKNNTKYFHSHPRERRKQVAKLLEYRERRTLMRIIPYIVSWRRRILIGRPCRNLCRTTITNEHTTTICSVRSIMIKYLEKTGELKFDKIFSQRLGFLLLKVRGRFPKFDVLSKFRQATFHHTTPPFSGFRRERIRKRVSTDQIL